MQSTHIHKHVDLLATSGDVTFTWTSPIYPKLYSNDTSINPLSKPITEDQDAWVGSLLIVGAVIGPFPYGFIAEKYGRKIGLLCVAVPHIFAYFSMAFANHIYWFYFGRFCGGLALGGGYAVLPMYIAEVSQDNNRGMMTQTVNVFWAIGNFIPYSIGPFISIMWFNLILTFVPAAFFVIFLFIGPETPYYLVGVNKIDKAEKALMLLRSRSRTEIQDELLAIKKHFKKEGEGHFSDLFKERPLRKALLICIVLTCTQELGGFSAITFHLQTIFDSTGTKIAPDISALLVGIAMLISSFFAPFLVDKAGRRPLTILSCIGMCLSLTLLGTFFYIKASEIISTDRIFWIPVFSLIFYIFSFNIGICSIPWTLSSELFPIHVKQVAASTISLTVWTNSFLMTKFFNDMNDKLGTSGTFWFFASCCLFSAIFSFFFVPETKGKSFQEIQDVLKYGSERKRESTNEMREMLEDYNMKK